MYFLAKRDMNSQTICVILVAAITIGAIAFLLLNLIVGQDSIAISGGIIGFVGGGVVGYNIKCK